MQLIVGTTLEPSLYAPQLPNLSLAVWLVELFLSILNHPSIKHGRVTNKDNKESKSTSSSLYHKLVPLLFPAELVELMLARVAVSLDSSVDSLLVALRQVLALPGVFVTQTQLQLFLDALDGVYKVCSSLLFLTSSFVPFWFSGVRLFSVEFKQRCLS
jgi:hypothetical protein